MARKHFLKLVGAFLARQRKKEGSLSAISQTGMATLGDAAARAKTANNFSILRLLFASLVIVSHSPEMIDANRSREILTQTFGTLSFGELSVDGFFLISGYLVAQSYVNSRSGWHYLQRRLLRIVPGYVVCYLLCLFLVAPLAGAPNLFSMETLYANLKTFIVWGTPKVPGAFADVHNLPLNGAMWTIPFEFRCYLLVMLLGVMGLYRGRAQILVPLLAALCLIENAIHPVTFTESYWPNGLGHTIRLTGVFLAGTSFYLFRNVIPLNRWLILLAAVALVPCMFSYRTAELAISIFGGYLVFAAAFLAPALKINTWAEKTDLSYGIYLYAWPLAGLLIARGGIQSPILLTVLTFLIVPFLAWASWTFIEAPAKALARAR